MLIRICHQKMMFYCKVKCFCSQYFHWVIINFCSVWFSSQNHIFCSGSQKSLEQGNKKRRVRQDRILIFGQVAIWIPCALAYGSQAAVAATQLASLKVRKPRWSSAPLRLIRSTLLQWRALLDIAPVDNSHWQLHTTIWSRKTRQCLSLQHSCSFCS